MPETIAFLAELEAAAHGAQREEIDFRNRIADEITRRERARQFAFRRLGLIKAVVTATGAAKSMAEAIAAGRAALRAELGWLSEAGSRLAVLDAWNAVTSAVWASLHPEDEAAAASECPSVGEALSAFEAWYAETRGAAFLALLDHEIPEMPVVEI